MPNVLNEPELHFTQFLFGRATVKTVGSSPQAQLGAWEVLQTFLRVFEQTLIWPEENVPRQTRQIYHAFVTRVLSIGEHLLALSLSAEERRNVDATVHSLRDKLVVEFSDATPEQSEAVLASIFGRALRAN